MPVLHITKDNFETLVEKNPKPVLLDFFATWCGPCRMVAPIVEDIAAQREDLAVGKINVDEEMELALRFGVSSIPTLVALKNGAPLGTLVGLSSREEILALFD